MCAEMSIFYEVQVLSSSFHLSFLHLLRYHIILLSTNQRTSTPCLSNPPTSWTGLHRLVCLPLSHLLQPSWLYSLVISWTIVDRRQLWEVNAISFLSSNSFSYINVSQYFLLFFHQFFANNCYLFKISGCNSLHSHCCCTVALGFLYLKMAIVHDSLRSFNAV